MNPSNTLHQLKQYPLIFIGSAPVGLMPTHQHHQQQYQGHRPIHATLSNSSAPLMRGSSSSSISASQDHLSPYPPTSPAHVGYPGSYNRLNNSHNQGATLPSGGTTAHPPPPPIKQRSFVHRRAPSSGNNQNTSPPSQHVSSPNRASGIYSAGTSPPYVNASAAEADLLNNSFGSDRGSNNGSQPNQIVNRQMKHQPAPRHAPKQPPPPAPTTGSTGPPGLAHPPYIPPPQPSVAGPAAVSSERKVSGELSGVDGRRSKHLSGTRQNTGNGEDVEDTVAREQGHSARFVIINT